MTYPNVKITTEASANISEEILSLLKASPVPLTATELRVKLRVLSLKLPEYEILRDLRSLREESLVCLEGGRWKATSPFAKNLYLIKLQPSNAVQAQRFPQFP